MKFSTHISAYGFIGFHTTIRLCKEGYKVIGIDNLNPSYSVELKKSRLEMISNKYNYSFWEFHKNDLEDKNSLEEIFLKHKPKIVINLAAQAGVRYSKKNPVSYVNSNINGFLNIISLSNEFNVEKFIYASSSSVYGSSKKIPFKESEKNLSPISLYGSTKLSNENIANLFYEKFNLNSIGLRFFTVYGPWGRPDMAPMIFTDAILSGRPIDIYNFGKMSRDFTFIDDVIEILIRLINKPAKANNLFNRNIISPIIYIFIITRFYFRIINCYSVPTTNLETLLSGHLWYFNSRIFNNYMIIN